MLAIACLTAVSGVSKLKQTRNFCLNKILFENFLYSTLLSLWYNFSELHLLNWCFCWSQIAAEFINDFNETAENVVWLELNRFKRILCIECVRSFAVFKSE